MTANEQFRARRARFAALHASGFFVLPNPWDVGSARLLASAGFSALATTSAGFAGSLGRMDQNVGRDELVAHVAQLAAAVETPINVDAENCYPTDAGGVAETVDRLAEAGAAGLSIEDLDPLTDTIVDIETATTRVAEAAEACRRHGIVLTARTENHLYGVNDLDDTITRLRAYVSAGAAVVYAPGLAASEDIRRVVAESGAPVNVLAWPGGPEPGELADLGVRRMSTGGSLAWVAYGALATAAAELQAGSNAFLGRRLPGAARAAAFGPAH
jgi:2-methylisocitrate lyase-like PEP mutase family enzyme